MGIQQDKPEAQGLYNVGVMQCNKPMTFIFEFMHKK